MIQEGDKAPSFELPAVAGRRLGLVTLEEFLGESAVVIVFYPADFNPSCTDETSDLDEFEVFRMQSDATVLAISGDSIYSHRDFARSYDLTIPLLSDVDGSVAADYGVVADNTWYPTRRAVFVLDHEGQVVYRWVGSDIEDRPDIDAVQTAFSGIEDADLATTQYRQACDRYDRARDTFIDGMRAYERHEWIIARSAFDRAADGLSAATDAFDTAARFSEDDDIEASFRRGERAASEFGRAIGLLRDSARAYAGGDRHRAEALRRDGETALERVRDLGAPPDPDAVPVELESVDPGETVDVSLDVEFQFDPESPADGPDAADEGTPAGEGPPDTDGAATSANGTDGAPASDVPDDPTDEAADIDDADLDALTAEIVAQDTEDAPADTTDEGDDPARSDADDHEGG